MSTDRITELRIRGMRAIESMALDINGLRVLIGDNGSGKSTIVEALEIVHHAAKRISHVPDIVLKRHGDLRSLLRRGCEELQLGISIEGGGPRVDYDFTMAYVGSSPEVVAESIDVRADRNAIEPLHAMKRQGKSVRIFDPSQRKIRNGEGIVGTDGEPFTVAEQALALPWLELSSQPALKRLLDALDAIRLHVSFETRPLWQSRELNLSAGPRWPSVVEPTTKLSRFGVNLPSAFQVLRNRGDGGWQRILQRARLGLGDDLRDLVLSPVGRGSIELEVVWGAFPDTPMPAELLSEGQVAYLCFVALCEFHPESSLLVFDEPELHLHPELLARVTWMLEDASRVAPIVVATHSDRLLDGLEDPASAVRLCELDERRAVRLLRPDRAKLAKWLTDYRGLGSLRADGYAPQVFTSVEALPEEP
ncbi:MAG: AAA family ATPase [Polyangiaceae bacterium]|nr:AAA family ATPase [Polyangiaceae bacterium]